MADKPILFSGPMVRALLGGTKTQTRRVCALPEPSAHIIEMVKVATDATTGRAIYEMKDASGGHVCIREGKHTVTPHFSPRIAVGDRLYVREAWRVPAQDDHVPPRDLERQIIGYEADCGPGQISATGKFRQAMHMPRWASRLTLTVTDVRVERLQDISETDAVAEGVERLHHGFYPYGIATFMTMFVDGKEVPAQCCRNARDSYVLLWDSINGRDAWKANPWVAAYTFTVERGNIDEVRP